MALLDGFFAQVKCREQCIMDTSVFMQKNFIATPNGLVADLYVPVEGRRHNSGMLADSAILRLLQQYPINQNGNQMCIYRDLAYPLRPQL